MVGGCVSGRNLLGTMKIYFSSKGRGVLIVALACILILGACSRPEPIRVGFSGQLTGKQSDLGVQGRNGVQMAVDEINAAGGIAGRRIELLVRDDLGTPEGARAADRALIEAGAVAIIGHMTSAQTMAALDVVEEAGVILISPTTSTTALDHLNDRFFRIVPSNVTEGRLLARRAWERHITRIVIVYDHDNAPFGQALTEAFTRQYQSLGGEVVAVITFSSSQEPNMSALASQLQDTGAEGVFIIASANDTALIAQHIRINGWSPPLFISGWAYTNILIQTGGRAVEGAELVTHFDVDSQTQPYREFVARYQERFGQPPTFAAIQSYETMMVLAQAIKKTETQGSSLSQALVNTRDFPGLTGPITLNRYGNSVRPHYLVTVRGGKFTTIAKLESEETETEN